jgi:FkbM family methyltransferase
LTMFRALAGSLVLNNLYTVDLRQQGLGAALGTALVPPVDYSRTQDLGMVQLATSGAGTPVDIVTLDSLALERLDFVKLDVEGSELDAIAGGLNTIQQHRPWIWIEYMITGIDSIRNALATLDNYDYYQVDYQNMLCAPRERRRNINIVAPKL